MQGGIVTGASRRGPMGRSVGSDTVAADLRAVLDDDAAHALVLHVDWPGVSSVASDTIWREVCRVRDAGKPVIVSMGSYAASGGYYVACPADVIVALPSTLTGSIGVFGGKVVVTAIGHPEEETMTGSLFELTLYEKQIRGSLFGSSNPQHDIPRLLELYNIGQLKLDELITREYALEDINQGYEDMRNGLNLRGLIRF